MRNKNKELSLREETFRGHDGFDQTYEGLSKRRKI